MIDWLNHNYKSVLMNSTVIGQSFSSAHDLLQKHEQFHKLCKLNFFDLFQIE